MKKILRTILILTLINFSIKASTNKTFSLPRSHGVNLAMEYSTWNELLQIKNDNLLGAHIQIVPFYQDSDSQEQLGKYFGIHNEQKFTIGYSQNPSIQDKYDVDLRYIFHDYAGETERKFTAKYKPEQEAYGLRIDYYQDLNKLLSGLYFKICFPIVYVENNMQLNIFDTEGITKEQVFKYYKGAFIGFDPDDEQKIIYNSKIHGAQNTTQLADIDFCVGCKFLDKPKVHIAVNFGATIPTGNKADGNWVFEPISGNGNHWGFGGGLDGGVNLWTKKDQNIKLEVVINYRYLFQNAEKRTFRLKHKPYSQYYLLVKQNDPAGTPLRPATNILTQRVEVDPGGVIDLITTLAYNYRDFRAELGYNFYWKDNEDVSLEKRWKKHKYGIAKTSLNVTNLSSTDPVIAPHDFIDLDTDAEEIIKRHDLDIHAAQTPQQDTHKFYCALGYVGKDMKYPLMIGVAAHYEIAYAHEGGVGNWGVWGKVGMAF